MSGKKQEQTLEQRVLRYIQKNGLLEKGQKVIVAVSGGPDSVCLLHCLWQLRSELGIDLTAAHLNHCLRGAESREDADFVVALAGRLEIPAVIEEKDVEAYRAEQRLTLEEAAREVRYRFLSQTAVSSGAASVAVGHTRDDHAETVLLHIIRGTGTLGLSGLQPSQKLQFSGNGIRVVRPLLEISHRETEEYCRRFELNPRLDSTNLSLAPLRNRVRQELIPLLERYNPAVKESLQRISSIARDDAAFLSDCCTQIWQGVAAKEKDHVVLDKKRLRRLSPALQRQLLRRSVNELLGSLKDIETRHIEELMEAMEKPPGRQIDLPRGLIFVVEYDRYLLGTNPRDLVPLPELKGACEIKIPGETRIPGWRINTVLRVNQSEGKAIDKGDKITGMFAAEFDREIVGDKLSVRSREQGDRFQPLGMEGTKKVGEFMLDAGIPRLWRDRIPIFLTPKQIVWVAGWRIDERVKITPKTRIILNVRMTRV